MFTFMKIIGCKYRKLLSKYRFRIILIISIFLASVLLFLQLPFAYYSQDIAFHSSKILAAKQNDYFTEAISGYKLLYPSLFHVVHGRLAALLNLNTFYMLKFMQVANFIGIFVFSLILFKIIFKEWEMAAFCALCVAFIVHAPTGKRMLMQIPYSFSLVFLLAGISTLILLLNNKRTISAIGCGFFLGIAVTIWWWNIIPVCGIALSALIVMRENKHFSLSSFQIFTIIISFAVALSYNVWALYNIRDVLPDYSRAFWNRGMAAQVNIFSLVKIWIETFITHGNLEFTKYLVPAALNSGSKAFIGYGILSSISFYLIVMPVTLAIIYFSSRFAFLRVNKGSVFRMLYLVSVIILILSLPALVCCDISVLRRLQFCCYLLLIPAAVQYMIQNVKIRLNSKYTLAAGLIAFMTILNMAFYSHQIVLKPPLSASTREVINFIESLPDHENTRIFTLDYDTRILAHYVRFRSFTLYRNPVYFGVDRMRADSIYQAYLSIVNRDENWHEALDRYNTKYAIIGKKNINQSLVIGKSTESEWSEVLLNYFSQNCDLIFENKEWAIFGLSG